MKNDNQLVLCCSTSCKSGGQKFYFFLNFVFLFYDFCKISVSFIIFRSASARVIQVVMSILFQ